MQLKPKIKEKRWEAELEEKIWKQWEKDNVYRFRLKTKRKIFSIDTPPPYPRLV